MHKPCAALLIDPVTAPLFAWPRLAVGLWLWLLVPAALAQGPALPRLSAPLLLLGEVHDNAAQHALRLQALQAVIDRGARPALLLEMLDRERQAAIDAVQRPSAAGGSIRTTASGEGATATTTIAAAAPAHATAAAPATTATTASAPATPATAADESALDGQVDALIDAAGRAAGWHWPFYRPYLRLALQYRLPVVAANVSRADARQVIQRGLAATGFAPDVPADIARAQAQAIEDSHCGAIDTAMAARLANAQVARDQFMASRIAAHADRGVVLLAGNGHVRRDIGVPRWLPADLRRRSHAVGYLEAGDDSAAAYDEVVYAAPQARPDPCADLRPPAAGSRPTRPAGVTPPAKPGATP